MKLITKRNTYLKRFNIAHLELNCFVKIIDYKHFAPTALIIINGNNIAAEQRNVYRESSSGAKVL